MANTFLKLHPCRFCSQKAAILTPAKAELQFLPQYMELVSRTTFCNDTHRQTYKVRTMPASLLQFIIN